MLIEDVSQWLVMAQHAQGERSPSFCAQPRRVSLQGGHRALPDLKGPSHHATYWENGPLILLVVLQSPLATLLTGCPRCWGCQRAAHEGLKREVSAPSPTMQDKRVLVLLEEKDYPKQGKLLDLVTCIYLCLG